MSGYPYGNPQYPPPQGQIYPQLYNPANAPAPGQPGQPAPAGYPSGANPQFPYQPGFAYQYPGQPQPQPGAPGHPASMSYPSVTPTAPTVHPTGPGFGYPGFPSVAPTVTPSPVAPVEWVRSNCHSAASLTNTALVAGYEGHDGSPLWVIRSHFEGDIIPGKLAIKHHAAYVPWGGKENAVQDFEVCCVARPEFVRWVESKDGNVPRNAIPGGRTSSGETLFIGRAKQQGSLTPGKIHPSHKNMYISFAGLEHPHKVYEVLCTA